MRALGCESDKNIINKIVYDPEDTEMCESLRASLEESSKIMNQDEALDYIARRGAFASSNKQTRIMLAQKILTQEFLPHISTLPEGNLRKAYFVGYMVNRLIQGQLGKTTEDDRDYYGKKRMDMAGALLSQLFRQEFRKVVDEMVKLIRKELEGGKKEVVLGSVIKSDMITRGLRSALATGNWGRDK
jgi:DNA-directed RNA polymerase II subunit RPB2